MDLKRLTLILLSFLFACAVRGQSPELDSLKQRLRQDASSESAWCDLCEGFAAYEMVDSTLACLNEPPSDLSTEGQIRSAMARAIVLEALLEFKTPDSCYRAIFPLLSKPEVNMTLKKRALEQAMAFYRYFQECGTGLDFAKLYYAECSAQGEPRGKLAGLMELAFFYECLSDTIGISQLYDTALAMATSQPKLKGLYHEYWGERHYYFGEYAKTVAEFVNAQAHYQSDQNLFGVRGMQLALGDVYQDLRYFSKANRFYLAVLPYVEKSDRQQLGTLLNTIGWGYYRQDVLDSALHYFKWAMEVHRNESPTNPEIAYPYGNLGLVYRKLSEYDSALKYSMAAMPLFERAGELGGLAEAENNIGFVLLEQGNAEEAQIRFENALEFAKEYDDPFEEMHAHHGLYKLFKERDLRKALEHYEHFANLRTENVIQDDAIRAQQYETDLLLSESEERIDELEMANRLQALEIERNNTRLLMYSIGFVLILTFGLLIAIYWLSRRKLLHQLGAANADNQKIISMISHDFRGPINNIAVMLEMMQRGDLEKGEFEQLTKDLYRQSSDVSLMFDSFLGWAIAQSEGYKPQLSPCSWEEIVNEIVNLAEPVARMKKVDIAREVPSDITVTTDRMAVLLILRNIMANAIKYSHESSQVILKSKVEGDRLITCIRDFGVGMDQEELEKISSPTQHSRLGTHREYGSGIGLRMAMRFAEALGGSITPKSKPGEGSTFYLDLPLN